jgi:hypothetical protein
MYRVKGGGGGGEGNDWRMRRGVGEWRKRDKAVATRGESGGIVGEVSYSKNRLGI